MTDLIIRPVIFQPALMTGFMLLLLLGMALTGCIDDSSMETSRAETISRDGDLPIVRVGDTMIYESDVQRAAKAQNKVKTGQLLNADDVAFQGVLNELIDQRLLKLEASRQNMERVPEVRRRLSEARERILATYLVEEQLKQTVTDEALLELYTSQTALRQNAVEANARLIQVPTEDAIKVVAEKLSGGADFGKLASEISTEPKSRDNNGELGYVSRVMVDKEIGDAIFSTKSGARSEPFVTKDGWAIVDVLGFSKPQQASFESMRAKLRQYKTYAEIDSLMMKLRQQSDVEILDETTKMDSKLPDEADNE